jgi:hypothetical protein
VSDRANALNLAIVSRALSRARTRPAASMDDFFMPKRALDGGKFELKATVGGGSIVVRKGAAADGYGAGAAATTTAGGVDFGAAVAALAAAGTSRGGGAKAAGGAGASSSDDKPAAGGAGAAAPAREWRPSTEPLETRFALCRSVAEECIQDDELMALLKAKAHPVCYDGFEPSGRMHIAQGLYKAMLVNRLTRAGCVFKFWVADWFALLNNKMGGDLKKIRNVGKYMIEVRRTHRTPPPGRHHPHLHPACIGGCVAQVWKAAGMDMTNVEFLWASDEINAHANDYWLRVMDIARRNNVPRVSARGPREGRGGGGGDGAIACAWACACAWLRADRALLHHHGPQGGGGAQRGADLLPLHAGARASEGVGGEWMDARVVATLRCGCRCRSQAADIFFLKADICQLGMDQRKVRGRVWEEGVSAVVAQCWCGRHGVWCAGEHAGAGVLRRGEDQAQARHPVPP